VKYLLSTAAFLISIQLAIAQGVAINTDDSDPDTSAILDVKSTAQGVLFPRMSIAQRDAISTPVEGLMIYQTDNTPGLRIYDGTSWNLVYPAVAYLSDAQSPGTNGGSSVNGWQTRILNTVDGNTTIFASALSGNFFNLLAGTYLSEGSVIARLADTHQARIWNVTDNILPVTDNGQQFYGTTEQNNSSNPTSTRSFFQGQITISTNKQFRIDQFIETALATTGLGEAGAVGDEIYTIIKITKIAD